MANYVITLRLIERSYLKFIKDNKGKQDCVFYLGISKDKLQVKFGITHKGIGYRKAALQLHSIHQVMVGNPLVIAGLEIALKIWFNSHIEFRPIEDTHKIIKFIKAWKSNL